MTITKIVLSFIALTALLIGGVFVLQGVNVLKGSSMTGDMRWTYIGAGLAVVAVLILVWALRTPGVLRGLVGVIGLFVTLVGVAFVVRGLDSVAPGHMTWAYIGGGAIVVGLLLEAWMTHALGAAHNIFASFGVVLIIVGVIWILQGERLLPSRMMYGHVDWAYRGGVLAVIGLVMLLLAGRKAAALARQ